MSWLKSVPAWKYLLVPLMMASLLWSGYSLGVRVEARDKGSEGIGAGGNGSIGVHQRPPVGEGEMAQGVALQGLSDVYRRTAPLAFQPAISGLGYSSTYYGCIYTTNIPNPVLNFFAADVQLPNGAQIDSLTLYYLDTSPSNSTLMLSKHDGQGGFTNIASVASEGSASGYRSRTNSSFNYTVNNQDEALLFVWTGGGVTGGSLALCGAQLHYKLNQVYMPLMLSGYGG